MKTSSSKLRSLLHSDNTSNVSPDWASLSGDLVEQIGWRVLAGDLHDYVRFRATCSHWSASTPRTPEATASPTSASTHADDAAGGPRPVPRPPRPPQLCPLLQPLH
ncbi:unnamed protein product [Urochloa humidicola]